MAYFLFDTETTGLDPDYHEICSLSAFMLDDNLNYKAQGHMKLMPEHWDRAESQALAVNGIDPKTWKASHDSSVVSIQKMIDFIDKIIINLVKGQGEAALTGVVNQLS